MKNNIYILLFSVNITCCTWKNNDRIQSQKKIENQFEDTFISVRPCTSINNKLLMKELIDSAILQGDSKAYNKVASYYLLEDMGKDFFYYAFTMANKYKNEEAAYHVYKILVYEISDEPKIALNLMDTKTKYFALYYLLKSYEMGYESAKYQVDEVFGKNNTIPKSSEYLKKLSVE